MTERQLFWVSFPEVRLLVMLFVEKSQISPSAAVHFSWAKTTGAVPISLSLLLILFKGNNMRYLAEAKPLIWLFCRTRKSSLNFLFETRILPPFPSLPKTIYQFCSFRGQGAELCVSLLLSSLSWYPFISWGKYMLKQHYFLYKFLGRCQCCFGGNKASYIFSDQLCQG